jgi:hypothetical protein
MSGPKDLLLSEPLLLTLKAVRDLKLELEALKSMFFEHRPPFIEAFAHHRDQVEKSGALAALDAAIARLEQRAGGAH